MAADRKRSKQRQQQRREERLAKRGETDGAEATGSEEQEELLEQADLEVGAPPEDIGRSDRTLREDPPPPSFETDDETLAEDSGSTPAAGPKGVRGAREGADGHQRGRLLSFLVAVWAELQRVQWPDRKQLTQLTGVVLFFVIIVGAYLGALDAVFSKLIQAIL